MAHDKEQPESSVDNNEPEHKDGGKGTESVKTTGSDQIDPDSVVVEQAQYNSTASSVINTGGEPPKGYSKEPRIRSIERTFAFLANLAVVVGVTFALYQIVQADRAEKRRVAIEAVSRTRSPEFLKAYRQLKVVYNIRQVKEEDKEALLDSLNHVMNVYDNIAILYKSNLADKCIIKNSIQPGAQEASEIAGFFSYSPEYRKNFDSLLSLMKQEPCGREMDSASQQ